MPKYGTCSQCGTTVWLTDASACPNGHGPEFISGVVETASQTVPGQASGGGKSSKAIVTMVIVVVVLLLCCLVGGILVSIALPVFNAASTNARERACFAEQRVIEGAVQQWMAAEEGRSAGALPAYDAVVNAVVPDYIPEEPVCTEGGTYEYDPVTGEVTCSVHGHYY